MDDLKATLGKGTDFEANIKLVHVDGEWSGAIIFVSDLYSPVEMEYAGITVKFGYHTPSCPNGAVAMTRAKKQWEDLRDIFISIEQRIAWNFQS